MTKRLAVRNKRNAPFGSIIVGAPIYVEDLFFESVFVVTKAEEIFNVGVRPGRIVVGDIVIVKLWAVVVGPDAGAYDDCPFMEVVHFVLSRAVVAPGIFEGIVDEEGH
jgi:hypothetical protein